MSDLPGMSLNCLKHLCIVLKASVTLRSSCSGSIYDSGLVSQLWCQFIQLEVVVQRSINGWNSFISFWTRSYYNTQLYFTDKQNKVKQRWNCQCDMWHSYTYVCDRNTKKTLSVVVHLGHSLTLLQLLAYTLHLIGHLIGVLNVSMTCKPSNQHLSTQHT